MRVTWTPDSKIFQVQNREQTWLDMRAGDVASGDSRLVWRETSDCWVEAGPEPVWIEGGASFLWLSERDGYKHVYRWSLGEAQGRLTEGEWQAKELVSVDEQAGCAYVLSDKDSRSDAPLPGAARRRRARAHHRGRGPTPSTWRLTTRRSWRAGAAETPGCVYLQTSRTTNCARSPSPSRR